MKNFLFYFLIANLLLLASNIPLFIANSKTPPGSYFPLYHHNAHYDYNVYLSVITQGKNGQWLMKDAYTSEKTNPTVFYFYYILLGKVASIFNLSAPPAYHMGRLISAELYLVSLFFLLKYLSRGKLPFWAYPLPLFGTILPPFLFNQSKAFYDFFPWWGNLESLKRLDDLPHYLLGFSFLFINLTVLFRFRESLIDCHSRENVSRIKSGMTIGFLSLAVFFAGIIFPPSQLPILLGIPTILLLTSLHKIIYRHPDLIGIHTFIKDWIPHQVRDDKLRKSISIPSNFLLLFPVISAAIAYLVIWKENYNGFPWDSWNKWEIAKWNNNEPLFNWSLLLSYGIMPLICFYAAYKALRKNDFEKIFLAFWGFMPFILLPVVSLTGFSKYRIISSASSLGLGILVTLFIHDYWIFGKKKIALITLFLFLATSIPVTVTKLSEDIKITQNTPIFNNIYFPPYQKHALDFITNNLPKDSVILSNEFMGIIFPAYAPVRSFFAHPVHTKDFFLKQGNIIKFFASDFSEKEAREFLKNGNITSVYYGPDEKFGEKTFNYSFLTKIFEEGPVRAYKVII